MAKISNGGHLQVSGDGASDQGGKGGCGEKLVSPQIVRNSGCILKAEPTIFHHRLGVMFEKMREATLRFLDPNSLRQKRRK